MENQIPFPKKNSLSSPNLFGSFAAEFAKKIGHPAPFPIELPYRLIQLYTFKDEVVLDPFMGSGQTAVAALKAGRHYVGYETNGEYLELAQKRISKQI